MGRSVVDPRGLLADITPLREITRLPPAVDRLDAVRDRLGDDAVRGGAAGLPAHRLVGSGRRRRAGVGVPSIAFGLFGGASSTRSTGAGWSCGRQSGLMAVSTVFAVQAFASAHSVWLLYAPDGARVDAQRGQRPGPADVHAAAAAQRTDSGRRRAVDADHAPVSIVVGPLLAGLIVPVGGLKLVLPRRRRHLPGLAVRRLPAAGDAPRGHDRRARACAPSPKASRFLGRNRVLARRPARRHQRDPARHAGRVVPGDQCRTLRRVAAHARPAQRGTRRRRHRRHRLLGAARRVHRQGLGVLVAGAVVGCRPRRLRRCARASR